MQVFSLALFPIVQSGSAAGASLDGAPVLRLKCLPALLRGPKMPQNILIGQVWRNQQSGENYLVTRIYKELFTTYAVLRKVGDEAADGTRVKVGKSAKGVVLPGYVFTQEER